MRSTRPGRTDRHLHRFIAAAMFVALLAVGCGGSESTGPAVTSSTPKAGSSYTFYRYDADTSGMPTPGSEDTVTVLVASTTASIEGKSNVHIFAREGDTTARIVYEANGDVQIFQPWLKVLRPTNGWLSLPVGTKAPRTETLIDSTLDLGGGMTGPYKVTLKVSHLGSEAVTVGSESIATEKVQFELQSITPFGADATLIDTDTYTYWYAPKLGYITREEKQSRRREPGGTVTGSGVHWRLTSYTMAQ